MNSSFSLEFLNANDHNDKELIVTEEVKSNTLKTYGGEIEEMDNKKVKTILWDDDGDVFFSIICYKKGSSEKQEHSRAIVRSGWNPLKDEPQIQIMKVEGDMECDIESGKDSNGDDSHKLKVKISK